MKKARKLVIAHQFGLKDAEKDIPPHLSSIHSRNNKTIYRLIELIWVKAVFGLRSEVNRNYFSYLWWILEPILHILLYYMVFGFLLHRGGKDYLLFLLTGQIPWMWFNKSIGSSSGSILYGQNLMLQVGLPSIIFPLVKVLQATLKQIPVFIILVVFLWFQGYIPDIYWLALLPLILAQTLLCTAVSCAVAALIPFSRDLLHLVPTFLQFLMFLSGIFYDYRNISPNVQDLFLLNPVAFMLKSYREIFLYGTWPDLLTLSYWCIGSACTCLFLLKIYQRLRYIYPRLVLE
jgi:lipopolysaccharide transport system permease protein